METIKNIKKEISTHHQLVNYFSDMALATRGFRPKITVVDTANLKKTLTLKYMDQTRMEQIMLYFLADPSYRNLGPSIATLLSATVVNSLRNKMLNRAQFFKELNSYADRYLKRERKPHPTNVSMSAMINELYSKLSVGKSVPVETD